MITMIMNFIVTAKLRMVNTCGMKPRQVLVMNMIITKFN